MQEIFASTVAFAEYTQPQVTLQHFARQTGSSRRRQVEKRSTKSHHIKKNLLYVVTDSFQSVQIPFAESPCFHIASRKNIIFHQLFMIVLHLMHSKLITNKLKYFHFDIMDVKESQNIRMFHYII